MPWEQTGDHIRSGHGDASSCEKGSFRTNTIDEEQGIKAVICKPHGSDSTVTQSFLFPKAKGWTLEKAKEWFSKHERTSAGAAVRYCVAAKALERDGKRYALVEVIDESLSNPVEQPSGARVRINPAGKARALASVLEKPLLGPPEVGHAATEVVGRPVDFTSNHATRILYEIQDPSAWEHIESGDWGPVSPQLTPVSAHYEGDELILDEWVWDHVAFVPKGAFPSAGVRSTCIGDPRLCGFTAEKPCGFSRAIMASLIDSPGLRSLDDQQPRQDVAHYSPEGKQVDREKTGGHSEEGVTEKKSMEVDACMTCEHEKVIAELTEKNTGLTDENTKLDAEAKDLKAKATDLTKTNEKLEAELKDLKAKPPAPVAASDAMVAIQAELKSIKAEYETLKAWKAAQEEADHMKRVQDVVDRRIKAGLLDTKKVQAAVESLKKLPNDALDAMKADLEAVQGKFDSLPSGPKARLIPSVAARFDPMQPTVGDLVGKKLGEK